MRIPNLTVAGGIRVVRAGFDVHEIDALIDLQSFGGSQEEFARHAGRTGLDILRTDARRRNVEGIHVRFTLTRLFGTAAAGTASSAVAR